MSPARPSSPATTRPPMPAASRPSATPPQPSPRKLTVTRTTSHKPMIPRYSRPDMVAIWSPETRFRIWFEIEAHATTKLAELGVVPQEAADTIWAKGKDATFDVERIDEIERT